MAEQNDNRRKKFYDQLSVAYDLGSFEEFDSKMNDANSRRRLYDFIDSDGKYDIGDFNYFDEAMKPASAVPPAATNPDNFTFTDSDLKEQDRRIAASEKAFDENGYGVNANPVDVSTGYGSQSWMQQPITDEIDKNNPYAGMTRQQAIAKMQEAYMTPEAGKVKDLFNSSNKGLQKPVEREAVTYDEEGNPITTNEKISRQQRLIEDAIAYGIVDNPSEAARLARDVRNASIGKVAERRVERLLSNIEPGKFNEEEFDKLFNSRDVQAAITQDLENLGLGEYTHLVGDEPKEHTWQERMAGLEGVYNYNIHPGEGANEAQRKAAAQYMQTRDQYYSLLRQKLQQRLVNDGYSEAKAHSMAVGLMGNAEGHESTMEHREMRDLIGEHFMPAITSALEGGRERYNAEMDEYLEGVSQTRNGEGDPNTLRSTMRKAEKQRDPDAILADLQERVNSAVFEMANDPILMDDVWKRANEKGMDINAYIDEYVGPEMYRSLQENFEKEAVKDYLPKRAVDYVLRGITEDNIIATLINSINRTASQNRYAQLAGQLTQEGKNPYYQPGIGANIAHGVTSMVPELPLYGVYGRLYSPFIGKMQQSLITKGVRPLFARMRSGSVSGALTLGSAGATTGGLEGYANGDGRNVFGTLYDVVSGAVEKGGPSFISGFGMVGGPVGQKVFNGGGFVRSALGWGTQAGIDAAGATAISLVNGDVKPKDLDSHFFENFGTFLALGGQHKGKEWRALANGNRFWNGVEFKKEEIKKLEDYGSKRFRNLMKDMEKPHNRGGLIASSLKSETEKAEEQKKLEVELTKLYNDIQRSYGFSADEKKKVAQALGAPIPDYAVKPAVLGLVDHVAAKSVDLSLVDMLNNEYNRPGGIADKVKNGEPLNDYELNVRLMFQENKAFNELVEQLNSGEKQLEDLTEDERKFLAQNQRRFAFAQDYYLRNERDRITRDYEKENNLEFGTIDRMLKDVADGKAVDDKVMTDFEQKLTEQKKEIDEVDETMKKAAEEAMAKDQAAASEPQQPNIESIINQDTGQVVQVELRNGQKVYVVKSEQTENGDTLLTLVDEQGNPYIQKDENGNVIDKFPPQIIKASKDGTPEVKETTPAEAVEANEVQMPEVPAIEKIPVDENGEYLWEQAPAGDTAAALRERLGDEKAMQMVDEEIDDQTEELNTLREKKVKGMNERLKKDEEIKAAEERLAYWQSVKGEATKVPEGKEEKPVEPVAPIEEEQQIPVQEEPKKPAEVEEIVEQEQPAAEGEQPVSESQQPVVGGKQAVSEAEQPVQLQQPLVQKPQQTAEQKVAEKTVKNNIGKTFEYVGSDGSRTEVKIDRVTDDGNVEMTVQRFDALGRPVGNTQIRVSKVFDVGSSIVKGAMKPAKDVDEQLKDIFKGKPVHYKKTLDVLTDEEKMQLLRTYQSQDEDAFNTLYNDLQMKHFADSVMKERDDRNIDVERIIAGSGTKEEKLRKIRKLYQGISDEVDVSLSDESMAPDPESLVELVADILGNVPKPGSGTLAYYSYKKGNNKVVGLKDESGYGTRGFGGDTKGFNPWLAPKGKGVSLQQYAENIHSQLPEALKERFTDQDVRNALLEVFSSADRPSDIPLTILRNRLSMAEEAARRTEDRIIEGDANYQKVSPEDNSFAGRLKRGKESVNTEPTEGQKEAGNYKKGHVSFGGYSFTIENPAGSKRKGTDADGNAWENEMKNTYGYILGKRGKDGDHLDMFINDEADLDNWNGNVYVIDQVNPKTGEFDEHKVMYGFDSEEAARKAYLSNYGEGWQGLGKITGVSKDVFDKWLDSSTRKIKPFAEHSIPKRAAGVKNMFESATKALDEKGISIDDSGLLDAYGLKNVTLSKSGDHVTLTHFIVDNQGHGNGTRFMEDLARLADENGWTLALTPDASFGATSVNRLKNFYKRFGFKDNKGRSTDFETRESMVRRPQEIKPAEQPEAEAKKITTVRPGDEVDIAMRDLLGEEMKKIGVEVIEDIEEGERNAKGNAKMMGTTTRKRQESIGSALEGKELTKEQQAVVDVFSGKSNQETITLEDAKGKERTVLFTQGNDQKAGAKHSVFKHYETNKDAYTADEVTLVPDIIRNGERKQDGNRVSYTLEKDGVKYTVTTIISGRKEKFTNFYTDRKPTVVEQGTQNTANQRVQPQQSDSDAKVLQNTETAKQNEGKINFNKVEDKKTLDELDNGPTVKRYRAMQLIDGKLYPPMSAKVDGEMRQPTEIGVWEQSEERPDLVKNGKFVLKKGQKGQSDVPAAYNPYFHTSTSGLNDQFTSAYRRPELVVVEVEIPESELTSGYKAEGAKDAVGDTEWHSGVVNSALPKDRQRTVTLSRYSKVNRIVPDSEVADMIAKQLEGTGVEVPYNVVTPQLRQELEARGVKISDQPAGLKRGPKMQKVSADEMKQREAKRDEEQSKTIFDTSKKLFGTTRDIREAGYILPDGNMLDFSGRHLMNSGDDTSFLRGRRTSDHREIMSIKYERDGETETGVNTDMPDFIRRGAIRIDDNAGTINLYMKPTKEQRSAIRKLILDNDGYVQIDFGDGWDSDHYVEYDGAKPSRVMADIDRYFDEGIQPEGDAGEMPRYQKVEKPMFYSNAEKAVEGIKQEKATPEQWLKMIEKGGGLKAGEDKWLGLSDWLKSQDKKSLTKQDVIDYIRQNQVQLEEVKYSEQQGLPKESQKILDEYNDEFQELIWEGDEATGSIYVSDWVDYAYDQMVERYGDDFKLAFDFVGNGSDAKLVPNLDWDDNLSDAAKFFLHYEDANEKPIHGTRLDYTTNGLENKKEIVLTVPSIESWNQGDELHFGDAGGGRGVAWMRFGDAYVTVEDPAVMEANKTLDKLMMKYDGNIYRNPDMSQEDIALRDAAQKTISETPVKRKKVLVIDEIQSKRHQEGRDKGYQSEFASSPRGRHNEAYEKLSSYRKELEEKYGENFLEDQLTDEERTKYNELYNDLVSTSESMPKDEKLYNVPDAPFEKNWHELAMKRMLRYAAENGYDMIAWTKGEQQSDRYSLSKVFNSIEREDNPQQKGKRFVFGGKNVEVMRVDDEGKIISSTIGGIEDKKLSEVVGKDLAVKLLGMKDGDYLDQNQFVIGGEGMKGFYDQMLPRFMDKYGKKWGVKTKEVGMPELSEGNGYRGLDMWGVDVTPEMKESVMQGQPMFFKTPDGEAYGYTLNGKIYIDPRIATSETPIHEYGHLWAAMKRQTAPEEWDNIKNVLLKDKLVQPFIDKVKREYPELTGEGKEDDFIEEVLTQFSGKHGAEKLRRMAEEIAAENGGDVTAKTLAEVAVRKIKSVLDAFWRGVANMMGWKYTTAEEIADKMLYDLLSGKNPNEEIAKAAEGVKKQLVGQKGAKEADRAEGTTRRDDDRKVAEEMEKEGKDTKAIKFATGWERGKDGMWRYETVDAKVDLLSLYEKRTEEMKAAGIDTPSPIFKLSELLGDKNELFKYYPDLKNMEVVFGESLDHGAAGSFDGKTIELSQKELNRIGDRDLDNESVYGTLLHEVQHAIQNIEGFAKGGSLSTATTADGIAAIVDKKQRKQLELRTKLNAMRKILSNPEELKMAAELEDKSEKEVKDELNDSINTLAAEYDTLQLQIDKINKTQAPAMSDARDLYHNLAGEVEARNVSERAYMSEEQRRRKPAYETEDVYRENQVPIMEEEMFSMSEGKTPEDEEGKEAKVVEMKPKVVKMPEKQIEDYYEEGLRRGDAINMHDRVMNMSPKELIEQYRRLNDEMLDEDGLNIDEQEEKFRRDYLSKNGLKGFGPAMADWLQKATDKYTYNKMALRWEVLDRIKELGIEDSIDSEEVPETNTAEYIRMQKKSNDDKVVIVGEGGEGSSIQTGLDSQGNPIDNDGRLIAEKVDKIEDISDDDFTSPSRTVALPKIPKNVDAALGAGGKPIIIKKNIFEKNLRAHTDLIPDESRKILTSALYNTNLYGQTQPKSRPNYWVAIHTSDPNSVVVLEIANKKDNVEIVGWRYAGKRQLDELERQAKREDGQLLILTSDKEAAAGLSTLPSDLSDGKGTKNISNDQEKTEKNVEKDTRDAVDRMLDEVERRKAGRPLEEKEPEKPRFQRVSRTPEDRDRAQYEADLKKWKAENGLPEDAEKPEAPVFQEGERALTYARRVMDYKRKEALWKTAPRLEDYKLRREDKEASHEAHMEEKANPTSYTAMMKRVAADLTRLRHAMSQQKAYDKETVKAVTDFAQEFMNMGFGDQLSKYEMQRILSSVKNATGQKNIKSQVDNILDIMMDNHLRNLDNRLQKMISIKELKQNAQGVEVQGKLELKGQQMIKAYREARQSRMTADELRERLGEIAEKMSLGDEQAAMWEQEYEGLSMALQYVENIDASRSELANLQNEYKDAVNGYKDSGRSYKEQQEYLESLKQSMQENKMERIGMYAELMGRMEGNLSESVQGAKDFVEAEKQRVRKIHGLAAKDMEGKPEGAMREPTRADRLLNSDGARFFLSPLATFEQVLKQFGGKHARGEGRLYNYFMRNWIDSVDKAYVGEKAAKDELDAKARDVFGKGVKRWSDLYEVARRLPTMDVEMLDGEERKKFTLGQGNLMYIYMADKMTDGRMKLRKMGISEEDVTAIKEHLDPRLVELADWLQDEYLPQKRGAYNKVHERMFGAPMATIDHYFPIKILSDSRYQEQDVSTPTNDDAVLPSTITGSIIKRRRNSLPLDILNTDALSLAVEHIEDMERWAAQAEWNRDVNTLLSYTTFRNQVKNMKTVYGTGEQLWNTVKDAARMAAGTYRPKVKSGSVDKTISNIAKGVTAAKISFRMYTAFKQILSAPAFLHDVNIGDFVKNGANPKGSWEWAMENMPVFRKRWESRQVGDTRLMEDATDWRLWKNNIVKQATRWGMSPNGLVDGITCAVGARSIYDSRLRKYLKMGMEEEAAKKRALQDAEIGYNLTQQSSEGAFVSQIQKDRTVAANMLSVFRNSSMSYTRQWVDAARNLKHMTKKGFKDETIPFMKRQLQEELGLNEEQAQAAAEAEYKRAVRHELARMLNMQFGVTIQWNLGAALPYLLLGDDDETKKEMLTDALLKGLIAGPTEGLATGNILSDLVGLGTSEQVRKAFKEGGVVAGGKEAFKQMGTYDINPLPLMADVSRMIDHLGYDQWAAAQDVFNIAMQSAFGVNPQTFTDIWNAAVDYGAVDWVPGVSKGAHNNDLSNAKEIALFIMRVMNAPTSSWRNKFIDELGLNADEARSLSYNEMARRYANYKHWKDAPLTGWLRSDEERQKKMEKIRGQFEKAVQERIGRLDEADLEHAYSQTDAIEERKLLGKEAANRSESDDYFMKYRNSSKDEQKQASMEWYLKSRSWKDLVEDLDAEKIRRQAKADGDVNAVKASDDLRKAIRNWIFQLGSEDYTLRDGTVINDAYRRQQIERLRRQFLDEYGVKE